MSAGYEPEVRMWLPVSFRGLEREKPPTLSEEAVPVRPRRVAEGLEREWQLEAVALVKSASIVVHTRKVA